MKTKNIHLRILSVLLMLGIFAACPIRSVAFQDRDGDSVEIGFRLKDLFGDKTENNNKEKIMLCPGGYTFGVKICGTGVRVVKSVSENGRGLIEDDLILKIDGKEVFSVDEVKDIVDRCSGERLTLDILRSDSPKRLTLTPTPIGDGYQLGVILSDTASGIGTVTYYNPDTGEFGGLGHGITDGKEVLHMTGGSVTGVILAGAKRGVAGIPGELRGVLTDKVAGRVLSNTECGVFGYIDYPGAISAPETKPVEIAAKDQVRCGEATIISTVKNGRMAEYKIRIEDIDTSSTHSKSFKIKVEDEALLALTGGIVRGMSGSPIIQDGKLIGAVTHVMVADPTEGYGIFIENMLNAAQMPMAKAS